MNERIRRLMEQAVISIDGQTFGKTYIPDEFTEKFAELIVRECQYAIVSRTDLPKHERKLYNNVLKQHFGVKNG